MTVLDASAVLALIHDEPGASVVEACLGTAVLSSVNLAEVIGELVDRAADVRSVVGLLESAGVTIEPPTSGDAELAGALRGLPRGRTLSLGDRCCLALAMRTGSPVLTTDRAWTKLDLGIDVHLVR